MCGIYLTNIQTHKDLVKKKLDLISHRGPDDQNINKVDDLTLGHVRLSILDLDQRSSQPMSYLDKTIVYNGEIYNYKDVREKLIRLGYDFDTTGDTEVLLKGFCEWKENLLNEINGMFAFAIYCSKSRKVFFARDRMGVKPLYYYYKNGNLEISSTLDIISNKNELRHEAINVYLQTGYIPSPLTMFEGVNKVLPGNVYKNRYR